MIATGEIYALRERIIRRMAAYFLFAAPNHAAAAAAAVVETNLGASEILHCKDHMRTCVCVCVRACQCLIYVFNCVQVIDKIHGRPQTKLLQLQLSPTIEIYV